MLRSAATMANISSIPWVVALLRDSFLLHSLLSTTYISFMDEFFSRVATFPFLSMIPCCFCSVFFFFFLKFQTQRSPLALKFYLFNRQQGTLRSPSRISTKEHERSNYHSEHDRSHTLSMHLARYGRMRESEKNKESW